mmetsp:Transcript_19081/g.48241  ORF Transcript_19081/g.48241 Transcript_19081/m.48241 type:complete len:221 (-) Transcript_19081:84-746(-)
MADGAIPLSRRSQPFLSPSAQLPEAELAIVCTGQEQCVRIRGASFGSRRGGHRHDPSDPGWVGKARIYTHNRCQVREVPHEQAMVGVYGHNLLSPQPPPDCHSIWERARRLRSATCVLLGRLWLNLLGAGRGLRHGQGFDELKGLCVKHAHHAIRAPARYAAFAQTEAEDTVNLQVDPFLHGAVWREAHERAAARTQERRSCKVTGPANHVGESGVLVLW